MSGRTIGWLHTLSLGAVCLIAAVAMLGVPVAAPAQEGKPATQPAVHGNNPASARAQLRLDFEARVNRIRSRLDELKLTEEQKAKADALFDKVIEEAKTIEANASPQASEESPPYLERLVRLEESLRNILNDSQKNLLDQVFLIPGSGDGGAAAFEGIFERFHNALAQLDLTPEQTEKADKATKEIRGKLVEVFERASNEGLNDESRQKIVAIISAYRDQMGAILTDAQKTKLYELAPSGLGTPDRPAAAAPATQANP